MSPQTQLKAQARDTLGSKVKRLRKQGITPANIFGKDIDSQAIKVETRQFDKVYADAGETGIVDLIVDQAKSVPVLINTVEYDPITGDLMHVDFRQVDLKEKITTNVPVAIVGEAPAAKLGAIIVENLTDIEVEALPSDLPEHFEIDISQLKEAGDLLTVADLVVSKAIEIKSDPETVVVSAQEVKQQVETETDTEVVTEEIAEGEELNVAEESEADK